MDLKSLFFVLFIIVTVTAHKKSYKGYKVYNVIPNTKDKVNVLKDVESNGIGEFWMEPYNVNHAVKVMVAKEKQSIFLEQMEKTGIETVEVIKDLQNVIDNQQKPATTSRSNEAFHSMTWNEYHNLDEINAWLDELVENYPDIVTEVSMGVSVENRDIKGIKINYNPNNNYIGMLEGTLHAREWISPAVVTWIIKEFLTSNDPEIRALAENFEWHIFPVVNPDGYEYSFTDDRMWRKNRNTMYNTTCPGTTNDDMSNGVDLNRNFGFKWMTVGASDNPCTNTFAGPQAFSEIESRNIAQYVLNLQSQGEIIYYIAFHSFTQLIVIPYSHVDSAGLLEAENYGDMFEIGIRAAEKAKERFGTEYRVGASVDVLYPMSGTSFDWVKHEVGVPFTCLIELRDLGQYGFLLPQEQIIPNSLEIMDFMLEMDRVTKNLKYYNDASFINHSIFVISFAVYIARLL
ncbi:zinc carboxypeptidase-like [Hyposmocoma kahamanoa]|uniref:zinc carboxypeptidase-like n=1 Tax=Hyposmocoma kahamanoa TaxID=1477025 RepID=UPI000E6D936D|nr:zinc carboxypeptidase-like [Hyposmocoma kahamanoa]